jgi:membrane protease YdiL (CAAX protease family)
MQQIAEFRSFLVTGMYVVLLAYQLLSGTFGAWMELFAQVSILAWVVSFVFALICGAISGFLDKARFMRHVLFVGCHEGPIEDFGQATSLKFWAWHALIIANLPILAYLEELLFRNGTQSWEEGLWRSVAFGLYHYVVGLPFAAIIVTTIAGLALTLVYFVGGFDETVRYHLAYNAWISAFGIFYALRGDEEQR